MIWKTLHAIGKTIEPYAVDGVRIGNIKVTAAITESSWEVNGFIQEDRCGAHWIHVAGVAGEVPPALVEVNGVSRSLADQGVSDVGYLCRTVLRELSRTLAGVLVEDPEDSIEVSPVPNVAPPMHPDMS